MLRYPVRSSTVEYIHVQCSTVFISFIWKRGMQFGADQSSEVQWTDCPVWYFPVQSRVVQCSAVWWSQAQPKTVQSSEVQCRPLQCYPAQSSPVHSNDVRSSPFSGIYAIPNPSSLIPIHSLPAKYISIQHSPGSYKSTAVESSPLKCSAEQCNP